MAEVQHSWKEVVEDWEWRWGNGLRVSVECNFLLLSIHIVEVLDISASGDWIIISSVCFVG